jgi:hypothetical protein
VPRTCSALLAGCQAERWNSQYSFSLSTERFYGTDMGVRDLFGNAIRILQPKKVAHTATA